MTGVYTRITMETRPDRITLREDAETGLLVGDLDPHPFDTPPAPDADHTAFLARAQRSGRAATWNALQQEYQSEMEIFNLFMTWYMQAVHGKTKAQAFYNGYIQKVAGNLADLKRRMDLITLDTDLLVARAQLNHFKTLAECRQRELDGLYIENRVINAENERLRALVNKITVQDVPGVSDKAALDVKAMEQKLASAGYEDGTVLERIKQVLADLATLKNSYKIGV